MAGPSSPRWSRRRFLGAAGAGVAAVALGACQDDGNTGRGPSGPSSTSTAPEVTVPTLEPIDHGAPEGPPPFGLGVASGDPDHRSLVLWTWVERAASGGPVPLLVEVARDEGFTEIVDRRELLADPAAAMTARVVVDGLRSDTRHWFRFVLDGHVTPPARTRTAPAPGEMPVAPLRVGQVSCQRWSSGYWTALDDVAAQAPDVVVHCGDYVYESDTGSVRPVAAGPPTDLDGFRDVWRRYKAEPELQAAHAVAPWLVTWDDHEVENNYQGADPAGGDTGGFLALRAAAYRAWWEFTPTRLEPPDGASLVTHRVVDWGALARFVLLDTRQHRDPQPCDDELGTDLGARCDGSATVTVLGAEQEAWFGDVATAHDAVWTTVVQQVVVHQWRFTPGDVVWNLDQWDGYTGARRRFLETLLRAPAPVVLSGDVHSSWVSDLRIDFDDDESPLVGTEFVAPGISSDIPDRLRQAATLVEALSPHIAWSETTKRGWVLHELDAETWRAAYRLVDDVSVPDGTVAEETTWAVSAARPGLA